MAGGDCKRLNVGSRPTIESVFNDSIHGQMEMHPLCVSIMDTPEFQRLRYIKQVGMAVYVYPGGNHTRFEHCIGVAHMAAVLVKSLRDRQPELDINNWDVLCAQIAGLCHDLGHGPFSHLWEHFMEMKRPKGYGKWTHEQMSVDLFDHIIRKHNLEESFKRHFGNEYETYIAIIKEQINGKSESRMKRPWMTRDDTNDKSFLYEVVSNDVTNIDVDKWDYLSRDCLHMGFKNYFDYARLLALARVYECDDGQRHICFSFKLSLNIQQMFHIRWELHRIAYQHKVVKVLDKMLLDVLNAADEHVKFVGSDGKAKCLSESSYDLETFTELTDYIFQMILYSNSDELCEARKILTRIEKRKLYGLVGHIALSNEKQEDLHNIESAIYNLIDQHKLRAEETKFNVKLLESDIYVKISRFDYGDKKKNPLEKVFFYTKREPNRGVRLLQHQLDGVSRMFPKEYEESVLFCVCRKKEFTSVVYDAFDKWCEHNRPQVA